MKEEDWSDPQPDSAIQPKARGLLHMEREYLAHHIWSRFRGLSTSQPRGNQKYLEDYSTFLKEDPEDVLATWSTRGRPAKYTMFAGLGYEELWGLSDPEQRDCL